MLTDHQTLRLSTVSGDIVEVEVNYSNNEKVKNCGVLRFSLGNNTIEIKKDDLVALMLAVGSVTDNAKMLPMKLTNVRKMERLLTFEWQASRNYEKGEKILVRAPWMDEVPTEQEIFAGNLKTRKEKKTDLIHKTKFFT